ncbi:hypothetical protein O6P43_001711 [Quillaja saponaria]|uniref:Uncharacterized protein n=1 Tax=Quillaja saponaria TaxID=32244 RepID=A0AAD7QJC1_QUISA|nr:hypothetical protein O6P43_001711 [Quillaja saponaria]
MAVTDNEFAKCLVASTFKTTKSALRFAKPQRFLRSSYKFTEITLSSQSRSRCQALKLNKFLRRLNKRISLFII